MPNITPEEMVEKKARELFAQRWPGKSWTGRTINRAYYRRIARAEVSRSQLKGDSDG